MIPPRRYLDGDWYLGGVPGNVVTGRDVYLDTSYAFAAFHSLAETGLVLGDACGVYDRSNFVVGPAGRATVGPFTCLNATTVICNYRVTIGSYCLLAWGVVITDTWCPANVPVRARGAALKAAAYDPCRLPPVPSKSSPVALEDNVWVGFDTVVLPGVTLGRGCVVGCRSVVYQDVPPYAIAVGNPARPIRQLNPDDTDEARRAAAERYFRETPGEGDRA